MNASANIYTRTPNWPQRCCPHMLKSCHMHWNGNKTLFCFLTQLICTCQYGKSENTQRARLQRHSTLHHHHHHHPPQCFSSSWQQRNISREAAKRGFTSAFQLLFDTAVKSMITPDDIWTPTLPLDGCTAALHRFLLPGTAWPAFLVISHQIFS